MTSSDAGSVRKRFRRMDLRRTVIAATLAVVPAAYLSWLLADFGGRGIGFIVGMAGVTGILLRRGGHKTVAIPWLRTMAVLLLMTPGFLVLPFVVNAGRFGIGSLGGFVLTESELVTVAVFALLAAVPAGIAQWLARPG